MIADYFAPCVNFAPEHSAVLALHDNVAEPPAANFGPTDRRPVVEFLAAVIVEFRGQYPLNH